MLAFPIRRRGSEREPARTSANQLLVRESTGARDSMTSSIFRFLVGNRPADHVHRPHKRRLALPGGSPTPTAGRVPKRPPGRGRRECFLEFGVKHAALNFDLRKLYDPDPRVGKVAHESGEKTGSGSRIRHGGRRRSSLRCRLWGWRSGSPKKWPGPPSAVAQGEAPATKKETRPRTPPFGDSRPGRITGAGAGPRSD